MASLKPEKPAGSVSLDPAKKEPVRAPISKQGAGTPKGEAQKPREPRKKASGAKPAGAKK